MVQLGVSAGLVGVRVEEVPFLGPQCAARAARARAARSAPSTRKVDVGERLHSPVARPVVDRTTAVPYVPEYTST